MTWSSITEYVHSIPPAAFAIGFVFLLLLTLFYLFWDEKELRRQLNNVMPERRVDFLLIRFRHRNMLSLVFITLIFCALGYLLEDMRRQVRHLEMKMESKTRISESIKELELQRSSATSVYVADDEPNPSLLLGLLESNDDWQHDSSLDVLKQQYENTLIGGYILLNCKMTNEKEITNLRLAMRADLSERKRHDTVEAVDADALFAGIISAAEGSYQMIYHRTPCSSPNLAKLAEQYKKFVARYLPNNS